MKRIRGWIRLLPFLAVGFGLPIVAGVAVGLHAGIKVMLVMASPGYVFYAVATASSLILTGTVPNELVYRIEWDGINLVSAIITILVWRYWKGRS